MKLEYKNIPFAMSALEEDDDSWTIKGYASTYTMDRGRDKICIGAYDESVVNNHLMPIQMGLKSEVKFLWQHQQDQIIGWPTVMKPDEKGLYVEAKFIKDEDFIEARKAYKLAKMGLINKLSIGYVTEEEKSCKDEKGIPYREIRKMNVLEFSMVTVPMQPEADITQVKSLEVKEEKNVDFETEFKTLREEVAKLTAVVEALVTGLNVSRQEAVQALQNAAEEAGDEELAETIDEVREELVAEVAQEPQLAEAKESEELVVPEAGQLEVDVIPAEEPQKLCTVCGNCVEKSNEVEHSEENLSVKEGLLKMLTELKSAYKS